MQHSIAKISVFILLSISMTSCKKYLDINDDPNTAAAVDPKTLFSYATSAFVNNRAGGDMYTPMALGGQSISGGGSSTIGLGWGTGAEDQYVFNATAYANIWTQYYTSVGANLKKAIQLAESSAPRYENAAAQCKVMLAQTFYELTTTYGDIPFTEALNDSIGAPKFDSQQVVLEGCIGLLDDALEQFDPGAGFAISGDYDMFYGGDISKWIRAAKSIKLRILMTLVDRDPSKSGAIAALFLENDLLQSPDDNFKISFEPVAGKRNPKYQIASDYNAALAAGGGLDFFYASPYVLNPMKASNDPRIPFFFDSAEKWRHDLARPLPGGATQYYAVEPGANADDSLTAKIASSLHTATAPEYLFTYQEVLFYKAESYFRGFAGTPAEATAAYRQAVYESCVFFGVNTGDAQTFSEGLPPVTSVSQIHLQHWIDKFDRGIDAFIQWRRSGPEGAEVPQLSIPDNAPAGGLFRRYEYPQNAELSSNPNAPDVIRFTEKTWFDL